MTNDWENFKCKTGCQRSAIGGIGSKCVSVASLACVVCCPGAQLQSVTQASNWTQLGPKVLRYVATIGVWSGNALPGKGSTLHPSVASVAERHRSTEKRLSVVISQQNIVCVSVLCVLQWQRFLWFSPSSGEGTITRVFAVKSLDRSCFVYTSRAGEHCTVPHFWSLVCLHSVHCAPIFLKTGICTLDGAHIEEQVWAD